jgi:isoleucyl-tRNA synthetase
LAGYYSGGEKMYDHKKIESDMLSVWDDESTFEAVVKNNTDGEPFYFCDGPPYATGQIHPGTAWNKTIKDAYCRYWRLKGRDVRAQAGFDTHGLPIEVKVEQELEFKSKNDIEEYGIGKFINKCKTFATKYIGVMGNQFKKVGVWMDFENPYITFHDDYIESSWKTLKMAWDKGLMSEGVYVLPYCYRCETTMANYELEYSEETDPSIYVKFKARDSDNEYLIIWTTTPWTLAANLGVMAHPTETYLKVQVNDEVWVVAKECLDRVMEVSKESASVIGELPGRKLDGIRYEHPMQDLIRKEADRKVVMSDEYVTVEEGTGLVHTAPGTGPEDFIIGKRFGLEAFCPVDSKGNYTSEAGDFEGKNVRAVNPEVISILEGQGSLVAEKRIKHRYPHCWRCKTPLIFLTTKQWFITVSKIKNQMLEEIDSTEWHPHFAKERFKEFVTGAPDWCISRQRYWGIPLPIWRCSECEEVRVIESRDELPEVRELHRPYLDEVELNCQCGAKMRRVEDVLDVWFDSGNAVWAPLSDADAKKYSERTDLIVEGQDQIRGWFYSLLGSGVVRYDACPYQKLVMHGHFVDEHGVKMSKSVGNFVPIEEVLEKYGADSFRLWGMSNAVWNELRFSWVEMKKCYSDLNIMNNMVVFLERFFPDDIPEAKELRPEDRWVISRMNSTLKEYREETENYRIHRAVKALRHFMIEDLSKFYMKLAKSRINSGDGADEALNTIYRVMLGSLKMLCPISPFISDHLYRRFFKNFEKKESIFLMELENENEGEISALLEKQMEVVSEIVSTGLLLRQNAGIKVRWPIRALHIETRSHEVIDAVNAFIPTISKLLNVREVQNVSAPPEGDIVSESLEMGSIHIMRKLDEELYEEGLGNEVKRRIQSMRKELGMLEKDMISVFIDTENEISNILKRQDKKLAEAVGASGISFEPKSEMKEFQIDGRLVRIAIEKE